MTASLPIHVPHSCSSSHIQFLRFLSRGLVRLLTSSHAGESYCVKWLIYSRCLRAGTCQDLALAYMQRGFGEWSFWRTVFDTFACAHSYGGRPKPVAVGISSPFANNQFRAKGIRQTDGMTENGNIHVFDYRNIRGWWEEFGEIY